MKIPRKLTPIALALPGLIATCVQAGFTLYNNPYTTSPAFWGASVNGSTGYTSAWYSGDSITVYRSVTGKNASTGLCDKLTPYDNVMATTVTVTYSWSDITYTAGRSNVSDRCNDCYPDSGGNGAESDVSNDTTSRPCA